MRQRARHAHRARFVRHGHSVAHDGSSCAPSRPPTAIAHPPRRRRRCCARRDRGLGVRPRRRGGGRRRGAGDDERTRRRAAAFGSALAPSTATMVPTRSCPRRDERRDARPSSAGARPVDDRQRPRRSRRRAAGGRSECRSKCRARTARNRPNPDRHPASALTSQPDNRGCRRRPACSIPGVKAAISTMDITRPFGTAGVEHYECVRRAESARSPTTLCLHFWVLVMSQGRRGQDLPGGSATEQWRVSPHESPWAASRMAGRGLSHSGDYTGRRRRGTRW